MGINPVLQLQKANSDIDSLQSSIADIEGRMDASILAESGEDISALRVELTKLKSALGQSRNEEAFWRSQVADDNSSRKSQADIARA